MKYHDSLDRVLIHIIIWQVKHNIHHLAYIDGLLFYLYAPKRLRAMVHIMGGRARVEPVSFS